jgi:hypothetical protein
MKRAEVDAAAARLIRYRRLSVEVLRQIARVALYPQGIKKASSATASLQGGKRGSSTHSQ